MDALTDANNPKCANTCGDNFIFTTPEDEKVCVESCGVFN